MHRYLVFIAVLLLAALVATCKNSVGKIKELKNKK
jgi:predicted small secreted protein